MKTKMLRVLGWCGLSFLLLIQTLYAGSMHNNRLKNLDGIDFPEKAEITSLVRYLRMHENSYIGSIYLIATSELGNKDDYGMARLSMYATLTTIEIKYSTEPSWMLNNSFLAWMWGRVVVAEEVMNQNNRTQSMGHLLQALENKPLYGNPENPAFFTWGWAYRASLNQQEYDISKDKMMQGAYELNKACETTAPSQEALSNALWAWVMNLQAAAFANDHAIYEICKKQIMILTNSETVSEGLSKGLLRTTASNDYPAWAMAKVRYAATVIKDDVLYAELDSWLTSSITEARKLDNKSEYILAVLENQLAIHNR